MAHFPFQRLQNDLEKLIAKTPAGQRLLNEPALAKQLGVSRATLREAMRTFETQGLIRRRQGSGTYVIGKAPVLDAGLEELESIETMARRLNLDVTVSDLQIDSVNADAEFAKALNVAEKTRLTRIRRVVRADRRPAAYLVDVLPETILTPDELPSNFSGSILDFLLARGDSPSMSRTNVSAIDATAAVAKALEIQRGDVLLHFDAQLFDVNGKALDYSLSYFIPGYFRFHIVRRVGSGR
ncbi:MAG: putative HTH-type transcriptional regulator YmfC [Anaerolineaceae bacterium]|nr:MAG: putative HTH-type transcriptional regulator YmfC [Anaerolineaceae bacterium]HRQ32900.1 GntR family transcriptional regulator [Anaerolineales bacterium]